MSKKQFLIKSLACLLALSMLSACGGESTDKDKDKDNSSIISSTDNNSSEDNSSSEDNNSSEDTSSSDDGSQTEATDDYDDEPRQPRPWQTYTPSDDSSYDDTGDTSDSEETDDGDDEIVVPYTKADLLELMNYLTFETDNYAIGVHAYGAVDVANILRNFENKFGQKPVVFDFDMTGLAYGVSERALSAAVNQLTEFAAEGGVIALTDHSLSPTADRSQITSGGANNSRYVLTREEFLDVMTEGTELNKNFKEEMSYRITFIKMLKDNNVPVIFRPLHEANGGWFWWGVNPSEGITGEDVANLYIYIHDYFTVENGLDNILWQFNTGMAADNPYDWYPGNEYIDLISTDWYADINEVESGNSYKYIPFYNQSQELGKYAYALSEFGGDGTYNATSYSISKSLGVIEAQIEKGAKCAYVGLYFEFGDDQDCALTDKALTLDEIGSYWDKVE